MRETGVGKMGLSAHARKKEKDYEQEGSAARGEGLQVREHTIFFCKFLSFFTLEGLVHEFLLCQAAQMHSGPSCFWHE